MCMDLVIEAEDKRENMGKATIASPRIRTCGHVTWKSIFLTPDDSNLHGSLRTTALKDNLIRLPPHFTTFRKYKSPQYGIKRLPGSDFLFLWLRLLFHIFPP